MSVSHTTVATRLGVLHVVGTAEGVCAVSLGEAAAGGGEALAELAEWAAALAAYVAGEARTIDVPVVLEGTDFQRRVWSALREIPYGETRTYAELAAAVGTVPRAAARACASNRIALAVPCHRVVHTGGGISGYRWGPARKAALLAMERGEEQLSLL